MGSLKNGSIRARILVWGPPGSGKTTTVGYVESKLKSNQKGPLEKQGGYELLPVKLGEVKGVNTELDFMSVPGAWDQAAARRKMLQGVDGIVFVASSIGSAMKDNQKSLLELEESLKSMGRSLVTVPVVFQWMNQRAIGSMPPDEMQAKLNKIGAQMFAVPQEDPAGLLKSFAAISKMAVKVVRDDYDAGKLTEDKGADIGLEIDVEEPGKENPFGELASELSDGLGDDFAKPPKSDRTPPPEDDFDAMLDRARPGMKAMGAAPGPKMNGSKLKLVGAGEPTLSPDGMLSLPIKISAGGEEISMTIQVKVVPDH